MQEERLAELLERYHSGESNAATSRELECVFSIKGIEVRQMVNRLRRKGIPIASSGSGYFYAATEQEVRATIAHLTRRISGIRSTSFSPDLLFLVMVSGEVVYSACSRPAVSASAPAKRSTIS